MWVSSPDAPPPPQENRRSSQICQDTTTSTAPRLLRPRLWPRPTSSRAMLQNNPTPCPL
ncbi:hypothetical protein GQ53DRAFT_724098, partial [Thozetella sp. PMI_491]